MIVESYEKIMIKNINSCKIKNICIVIMMLFIIVNCGKKTSKVEYEIQKVQKGDIVLSVSKTGQVKSENEISVYTTASQSVEKVFFKVGNNVKKGDVVVTFYPVDKDEALRNIEMKTLEIQKLSRNLKNSQALLSVGGESKTNVDDARIALQKSQLELATLREDLKLIKNEITSPVDGVITSMTADKDYKVNTQTTLFKVADISNVKVEVNLSDLQIKDVAVGQKVIISSDALGSETLEGYVSEISGIAEKSDKLDESTTKVTIKFNNTKNLRPGSTISANIFYKEARNVLKVPYSSIINENGKYYVYKLGNDNKVQKVEVKVGLTDSSYYEIISGLSENDNIVSVVDEALKDGQKIKIASEKDKKNNRK